MCMLCDGETRRACFGKTHICLSSNLNTLMDSRFSLADVQQKLFIDSDYHFLMQQNVSEEAATTSYTCYTFAW